MATADDFHDLAAGEARKQRRERLNMRLDTAEKYLNVLGFGWLVPLFKIAAGESLKQQLKEIWRGLVVPLMGIAVFLAAWAWLAPQVRTSLGAIPGPAQVWEQATNLYADHRAERRKEAEFHQRQADRNAKYAAEGKTDRIKEPAIRASRPSSTRSSPASKPSRWASSSPPSSRRRSASCAACRER